MIKLIVNINNYSPFSYPEYMDRDKEIIMESDLGNLYQKGQVVCIDERELGVILGCIDYTSEEVRVDTDGMICMDRIRPATVTDFGKSGITYLTRLYHECQGDNVEYDWEKYVESIKPN